MADLLPTLDDMDQAARAVDAATPATPQYAWPLPCEAVGTEVWVRHENPTPIGAFRIRSRLQGSRIGLQLSGRYVGHDMLARVLCRPVPAPAAPPTRAGD